MPKPNHECGWEKPRKYPPDQPDPRPGQNSSHYGSPSADERHSYGYSSSSTGNPGSQSGYRQPSQQATGYGTSQSTGSYQPQTSTYGSSAESNPYHYPSQHYDPGSYGSSQQNSQRFSGYASQTATSTRHPQQFTQAARDPYEDRSEYSGRTKSDAWDQDEYEQPFKQDSKSRKYDQNPSSKRQEGSDRYYNYR